MSGIVRTSEGRLLGAPERTGLLVTAEPSMLNAISAEWVKVRSVRSTLWTLAVVAGFVLLCGLWSWYAARYWDGLPPERQVTARAAPAEQPLVLALPICAAVFGALTITAECATGMIRTSLTAVPRRGRVFAAKAVLAGAVTVVSALVSLTVAMAGGDLIVGDRPLPAFAGTVLDRLPHLFALAASAGVIALVGCGVGAALRSTAGTITALVSVLLVLPAVAGFLPGSPWGETVVSVLPLSLPDQIAAAPGSSGGPGVLSPAAAIAVSAAYAAAALGLGAHRFIRKDAR